MSNFRFRSDLALDFKELEDADGKLHFKTSQRRQVRIETLVLEKERFGKKPGTYTSLAFEGLALETLREDLAEVLAEELETMIDALAIRNLNRILVCGLGNPDLSCDAIGPLLADELLVSAHIPEEDRQQERMRAVALLIPRVRAQTGMETIELLLGTIERFQPDLVIAVDALASRSLGRVGHVIQLTDAGMQPGSGVGNHTRELTRSSLGVPLICIGIPTVVDVSTVAYDVLEMVENHFAKHLEDEWNETLSAHLLGEFGRLEEADGRQLLREILTPAGMNMIVMDKSIDLEVKELASIVSRALNQVLLAY